MSYILMTYPLAMIARLGSGAPPVSVSAARMPPHQHGGRPLSAGAAHIFISYCMRKKVPTFLTEREIADVLRQPDRTTLLGKRDFAMLFLMTSTGLRRNELCQLRRGDLKTEDGKVWLYVWGKGGRQRKVPIAKIELLEALAQYWKKAGASSQPAAPMFTTIGRRGADDIRPISWRVVRDVVEKYTRLARIQKHIHPHSLRHSFITHALRRSGDLPAVQALAGHRSLSSTQGYLHTEDERMERAIRLMAS